MWYIDFYLRKEGVSSMNAVSYVFQPHAAQTGCPDTDKKIIEIMNQHKVVGLSAQVIKDGKTAWSHAYGWANLGKQIPVSENTFFRVASISKTVVATAIMQQYEQGKFRLDDDISDCLGYLVRNPHFPNDKITYRHVMTHTTGLQSDEETGDVYVNFSRACQNSNPPSLKEVLTPDGAFYTDNLWSRAKPGESFAYSNLGTMILGTLLEKLSGQRMDVYCREHIFAPLGMNRSSFNIQDFSDLDNLGVLYNYESADNKFTVGMDNLQGQKPQPLDLRNYVPGTTGAIFGPQGGLRTSAGDLTKYLLAHMNDGEYDGTRILSPETVRLMHQVHFTNTRSGELFSDIGLQFQITKDFIPGKKMIGHSGEAYGLLSAMYFSKEEGFGIVFIMNGSNYHPGKRSGFFDVEEMLADALYEEFF
jgi:CubicO group peptidase (beta-lactamase class C family)